MADAGSENVLHALLPEREQGLGFPRAAQEDEFGDFGYPFTNTIGQNTPENFHAALEQTRQRLLAQARGPRILNINCWNEWTEDSYLEPDTVTGPKYLEAVRDVFGTKK